ncbi:unnamed protein product [Allacma fusca]|uniref:Uncharacterized protein n=1 Tax=Allacma fusca TaxID=39272 RepID=A0A8J2PKD0_9HEXA|nr:unnamed protein product [Allacma fusca]
MSIHKGEFNSMLKKTGFLAQPKMEARLIAKHPQRFLENYADRKIGILSSENDALGQFLDEMKGAGDYSRKEAILNKKNVECKNRAFLLNLASSPGMSSSLVKDITLHPWQSEGRKIDYDSIIENYLMEIKMADKQDIEEWIATNLSLQDMRLPYGLPENLRMPLDPTNIEDAAICEFVEAANDEFLLLDGQYHTKMEEICNKLNQSYIYLTQNRRWTIAESALLFHIIKFLEESPEPSSASLQKDLTKKLFPDKTQEEIISHKYMLKSKRVLEEKRANIIRDWLRDKAELQSKTNSAWENLHKGKVKKLEKFLKIRKQKEICSEWAALLTKMRAERSENVKKIRVVTEPFVKKLEDNEKQRLKREADRKAQVKSAAQSFKEKKLEEKLETLQIKQEVEELTKRMQQAQLKANKSRVEIRKSEFEEKLRAKRLMEEKEQEEKKRKAEQLEKIKNKVEIDYDPINVLADTHATMVRRYEIQESQSKKKEENNDEEMVDFFRKRYSFAADTIWADRRVKVEAKLRDAGLMGSSYARQILQAMQPGEKPHLKTNIIFDNN